MASKTVVDQMGQEVTFAFPPKRIISLVPSQTEFLLDIGAPVVGRTKFCIHPAKEVPKIHVVGGTKNFRFDVINSLSPDLIIGNKEENFKEGIEELRQKYPVWMSDIFSLDDSFSMMESVGELCNLNREAQNIVTECKSALERVKGKFTGKVLYLIWKNPWMAAGTNTFIDHFLNFLGYENAMASERYPEVSFDQLIELELDKILFSSEPFPFKEKHFEELEKQWPSNIKKPAFELVDGELYSWYGSRLRYWV